MLSRWRQPTIWTRLDSRIEISLRHIAQVFDSITMVLIDHKTFSMPSAEGKEERKLDLFRQCPRLQTGANVDVLLEHLINRTAGEFWAADGRIEFSRHDQGYRRAIAILHDEVVDMFTSIQRELEESETTFLVEVSNSIRWRLAVLQPIFAGYIVGKDILFRKPPGRRTAKERETGAGDSPKVSRSHDHDSRQAQSLTASSPTLHQL